MKKIIILLTTVIITVGLFAQAPNKMSYQTVIRNSAGALVANQAVGMKISILQGSSSGTAVFVETQSVTTNVNGLASLEIGGGTAVTGTVAGIDWTAGPYFIKTETDPAGGTSYTITGTSELLSVPYALNASNGNWTQSGSNIYNANSGYVGIGTSSPGNPLDVSGAGGNIAGFTSTGTGDARILIGPSVGYKGTIGWANFNSSMALTTLGADDISFGSSNLSKEIMHLKANGFIGIGTASPQSLVHMQDGGLRMQGGSYFYVLSTASTGAFSIAYGGGTPDFTINGANTYLGQGFASSGPRLTAGVSGDGSYAIANSWTTFSDERFKTNITTLTNAGDILNQLRGVSYNWKRSGLPDVGFIAQEIEKVIPAIVHTDDKTGYKSVDYSRLIPFLVEALNAQEKKINDLTKTVEELKTR